MDVPIVGTEIVTEESVVRPYGSSLVWEVIPGDYFYTRHSLPQVVVEVDDMPTICSGLECSYNYYVGLGKITGFSRDGLALTITGEFLINQPTRIEMGYIDCSNIVLAMTMDSITCDLANEIPAGSWYPKVFDSEGQVKIDESVAPEAVDLTLSAADPFSGLNPAGGDIITITGTNFPISLDERYDL